MPTLISPSQLFGRLDKPDQIVTIYDCTITEVVKFGKLNCSGVVFTDCKFLFNIDFKDVYLKSGLAFVNCVFENSLFLSNSSAANQKQEDWKFNDSIVLKNTKIKDKLVINKVVLNNDFKIIEDSEINRLTINCFICNFGGVTFESSKFETEHQIEHCSFKSDFRIESCEVNSKIRVSDLKAEGYIFLRNTFKKDCWIWAGEARNGITFNEGIYEDDFKIEAVKSNSATKEYTPTLTFFDATFKKYCLINYADSNNKEITGGCPQIYISSTDFQNALIINEGSSGWAELPVIDKITIDASKKLGGELVFNALIVKKLHITGANYEASIIFNRVNFQKLYLDYFSNYAKIQFVDIDVDKEGHSFLSIKNSFLGNSQFSNVNFLNFKDVVIENSDLSQISTSCVTWFTEQNVESYRKRQIIKGFFTKRKILSKLKKERPILQKTISEYHKKEEIKFVRQKRELFRQLKFSLEKQGDKIQSLVFKQYEMRAFKKELQLTKKRINLDRFILWANQSNKYGQDWFKPVRLAFGFTFIFYCILTILNAPDFKFSPATNFNDICMTFKLWCDNLIIYMQLLNPVLDLNKIFILPIPSLSMHVIGYLHKLILSYFIFQTISAFRKYST